MPVVEMEGNKPTLAAVHSEAAPAAKATQGVTIGNRREGGPVPVLGDDVELGAYAQVLGGVQLGHGCKVGAMSVVLDDVPPGATAGRLAFVDSFTGAFHAPLL